MKLLIENAGGSANPTFLAEFIGTVLRSRDLDRGGLKILHRTVRALRYAFSLFERYRHLRKVTVFGSARTQPDTPSTASPQRSLRTS